MRAEGPHYCAPAHRGKNNFKAQDRRVCRRIITMRWFLLLGTVTATFLGGLNSPLAMESLKFDRHAVTVIDGDTIQVHDRVLQLSGIDTPELGQA